MKLQKFYSTDECNDEQSLFKRLDKLQKEGKIEYKSIDTWSIKIVDVDLTMSEEKDLITFLEKLDLYPTIDEDGDEEEDFEDDFDIWEPKGSKRSFGDYEEE